MCQSIFSPQLDNSGSGRRGDTITCLGVSAFVKADGKKYGNIYTCILPFLFFYLMHRLKFVFVF